MRSCCQHGANLKWGAKTSDKRRAENWLQLFSPKHKAHAHQDTTHNKTRVKRGLYSNTKWYLARHNPRTAPHGEGEALVDHNSPRATSGGI
eukprot:scaffold29328_cov63-Phaeocystis_antarctica.AAC.2